MPTKHTGGTQQAPPAAAGEADNAPEGGAATGDMSAALSSSPVPDDSSPQSPEPLTPAQSRMAALGMQQPFPPASTVPVKLRIFRGPLSATEKIWFWKDQMTDPQKLRTGAT
jgi:hypothetical protein